MQPTLFHRSTNESVITDDRLSRPSTLALYRPTACALPVFCWYLIGTVGFVLEFLSPPRKRPQRRNPADGNGDGSKCHPHCTSGLQIHPNPTNFGQNVHSAMTNGVIQVWLVGVAHESQHRISRPKISWRISQGPKGKHANFSCFLPQSTISLIIFTCTQANGTRIQRKKQRMHRAQTSRAG